MFRLAKTTPPHNRLFTATIFVVATGNGFFKSSSHPKSEAPALGNKKGVELPLNPSWHPCETRQAVSVRHPCLPHWPPGAAIMHARSSLNSGRYLH